MGDKQFVALPNVLYITILGSFNFEAYFVSAIFILQNGIESHNYTRYRQMTKTDTSTNRWEIVFKCFPNPYASKAI